MSKTIAQYLNDLSDSGLTFYQGKNGLLMDHIREWRVQKEPLQSEVPSLSMNPSMHPNATLLVEYFPAVHREKNRPSLEYFKGDGQSWQVRLKSNKLDVQYTIAIVSQPSGLAFTYDPDKRLFVPD